MRFALWGVIFCLNFGPFFFLLLFPCHAFFLSFFIYLYKPHDQKNGGRSMLMHFSQTHQLLGFMLWHHVARPAREYSKCFFASYNKIYAHYVRNVNEWFENFEIHTWKTTKYTDCKEKSVNKKKAVSDDEKPYLMNWSPYFVILFDITMIQNIALHRELKAQQISIKWARTFST